MKQAKVTGRSAADVRGAADSDGSPYVFTLVSREHGSAAGSDTGGDIVGGCCGIGGAAGQLRGSEVGSGTGSAA